MDTATTQDSTVKLKKLKNLRNRIARRKAVVWKFPSWEQNSVEGYNIGLELAIEHIDREIDRWEVKQ